MSATDICIDKSTIPGSAFAYWFPDSEQGIGPGPGPPGPQGGYLGDNPGPGLPWLGNILSGIFDGL